MQKLSYTVDYIYNWHCWFLTHFYQDNHTPYRISSKGNQTAYGLSCNSAKVKAWYVAPKVTGCVPVKMFGFEWAKKVVQEDISSGNYVLPWVTNIIGMFVSLASPHMKGD